MKCKEEIKKHLDAISELLKEKPKIHKEVQICAQLGSDRGVGFCDLCGCAQQSRSAISYCTTKNYTNLGINYACKNCIEKMFA